MTWFKLTTSNTKFGVSVGFLGVSLASCFVFSLGFGCQGLLGFLFVIGMATAKLKPSLRTSGDFCFGIFVSFYGTVFFSYPFQTFQTFFSLRTFGFTGLGFQRKMFYIFFVRLPQGLPAYCRMGPFFFHWKIGRLDTKAGMLAFLSFQVIAIFLLGKPGLGMTKVGDLNAKIGNDIICSFSCKAYLLARWVTGLWVPAALAAPQDRYVFFFFESSR